MGWVGLVLLVALAAAGWWMLDRSERRPDWLRVEAPRRAVAGQRLALRVHLAPLAEPTRLCVDLHWGPTRDVTRGYLAGGGWKAVGREGGTFDFAVLVPPVQGLRFVTGVLYLSRTGRWQDHTLVATTVVLPVSGKSDRQAETRLEPLGLQPLGQGLGGEPAPAPFPRWLTALLFFTAALGAWCPGRASHGSAPASGKWWWRGLAIALLFFSVLEVPGIESWLGAQVRAMARAWDVYYPRAAVQKLAICGALGCGMALLACLRRAQPSRRLLLAALTVYGAIWLVNLVSLHAIDRIANLAWHGVSLVQALKLLCAGLTLEGVRRARRR